MKSTEIQKLTEKLMQLQHEAKYSGEPDPFRAFWQGFDTAIDLALEAMKQMVSEGQEERVEARKTEREITSSTYVRAQAAMDKNVKDWMGV